LNKARAFRFSSNLCLLRYLFEDNSYVATEDLTVAVNAAITLERPLLVKGEPGTGKTVLAHEIAAVLGLPLLTWHIKSITKAQHGLYEYDAVARLRDGLDAAMSALKR